MSAARPRFTTIPGCDARGSRRHPLPSRGCNGSPEPV